jgi:hypothetical protein
LYFGTIGVTEYIYTNPGRALEYKETPENIENFKRHFKSLKGKRWTWVFDCADMEMKHYTSFDFAKQLAKILIEEHRHTLETIYIVRPNAWIRTTVSILQTFIPEGLCKKVRILNGEGIELFAELQKTCIRGPPLAWLLNAVTSTLSTKLLSVS